MATYQKALDENLDYYFLSMSTENYNWIGNPFIHFPSNIKLHLSEDEFVTISSDSGLKLIHSTVTNDTFLT